MIIFLITTATVLFIVLILNFGYYYFSKVYPLLIGQETSWNKESENTKLLIGTTALFFSYFTFKEIWHLNDMNQWFNWVLYLNLIACNVLFFVLYVQKCNQYGNTQKDLSQSSFEKKKIEDQIEKELAQKQEDLRFSEKVKEYQDAVRKTIAFMQVKVERENEVYPSSKLCNKNDKNLISNSFVFKKNEDPEEIANQFSPFFNNKLSDLIFFIDNPQEMNLVLNCTHSSKNRQVSYLKIFELLNTICAEDILDLFEEERKKMCQYIMHNFKRDGKSIDQDNLNTAFSKWRKKNA